MEEGFQVGKRLAELRRSANLSQRELAARAGVPYALISMIETDRSSPSVASLRKILGGFPISMSDFFAPEQPQADRIFFTPDELVDLTAQIFSASNADAAPVTLRQIGDARQHNLQILQESYAPGSDTGKQMLEHNGHEGGVVLAGEIEVTVGDQSRVLRAGDSYLFDSSVAHRFRNCGEEVARVISACTPPYL